LSPELSTALREETPAAPSELRERVALIAATSPPARRSFPRRRALLLAAPAAAVGSLAVALMVGILSSSNPPVPSAQSPDVLENSAPHQPPADMREYRAEVTEERLRAPLAKRSAVPAPSTSRAQDVQADLRVLVDDPNDLSAATQRALRTTRRLGGYVVAVDYGTPEPTEGTAALRLRVPRSRVQAAIVQFSGLGQILAQQTRITDLQQRLDELTRQIRRAKGSKARISALRRERTALNRRAAYSTVDLGLTTHEPEQQPATPGRLHRAIDDATGILAAELAIAAYVLIVAGPFLLLFAAALVGNRAYRRHADQRLLERA
jgi:Domain of unknown function (DUF4349)